MINAPNLSARVVKVNALDTPINRRYLVEMTGKLPADFDPMSGQDYQPIH